jgi:hypothetical protein
MIKRFLRNLYEYQKYLIINFKQTKVHYNFSLHGKNKNLYEVVGNSEEPFIVYLCEMG